MEQGAVVRRLYSTIIADACGLFAQAHQQTAGWSATALAPLARRLQSRKRAIEARLDVLRKVNESSEALDTEINEQEKRLEPLRQQFIELKNIQNILTPEDVA